MDQNVPSPKPKPKIGTASFKITVAALVSLGIGAIGTAWYLGGYIGLDSANPITYHKAAKVTPVVSAPPLPATSDPTAAWTKYSNATGKFSLRFDPSWKSKVCPDNPDTLYLGPTTAALAVCQSDSGGQMMVMSVAGDQKSNYEYGVGYSDLITTSVTVSGVTGERQSATVKESAGLGPEVGTKLVQYIFVTSGRTYLVTYQQQPSGATSSNALNNFDLMVKNTFKFSS